MSDLWFEITPVQSWLEQIQEKGSDDLEALYGFFMEGLLDQHSNGTDLVAWDRHLGRIFDAADPSEAVRNRVRYRAQPVEEREFRRWCWSPGWDMSDQDEDLMLMHDSITPLLLEEAAEGCPKRDYLLNIVVHHVRDQLHHALWTSKISEVPGNEQVMGQVDQALARAEDLLPRARKTSAPEVISYLTRIAEYRSQQSVSRAQAIQRVLDMRRCTPRPQDPVELERRGTHWVAQLRRANINKGEVCISVECGLMWAREAAQI